MNRRAFEKGFTVLEMSIILMAVSLIVGIYLSFYKPGNDMRHTADTRLKIDRVMNAVSAYALQRNYVPCPADPSQAPHNRGERRSSCAGNNRYGIIPYRDLGLSMEDAMDGYGYYMTYVVSNNITSSLGAQNEALVINRSHFCNTSLNSDLQLYRGTDHITDAQERAFVAIISHGPDGIGSFNVHPLSGRYGDVSTLPAGEAFNAGTTGRIQIDEYVVGSGADDGAGNIHRFDDIVGVMRRSDIIYRLNDKPCAPPPP